MANNQYVNKVIFGNDTLIDLSNDTVAANKMLSGIIAHDKSGTSITGNIPTRTTLDVTPRTYSTNGKFSVGLYALSGYYPSDAQVAISRVVIPVPETGSHSFIVAVPNGTTTPQSAEDWLNITFEVDSEGNSNVTDDTIPATGVSF